MSDNYRGFHWTDCFQSGSPNRTSLSKSRISAIWRTRTRSCYSRRTRVKPDHEFPGTKTGCYFCSQIKINLHIKIIMNHILWWVLIFVTRAFLSLNLQFSSDLRMTSVLHDFFRLKMNPFSKNDFLNFTYFRPFFDRRYDINCESEKCFWNEINNFHWSHLSLT